MKEHDVIESLARLEHEQWMTWSQEIANEEELSTKRLHRWRTMWIPYDQLPVQVQEQDRERARQVVQLLKHLGVEL